MRRMAILSMLVLAAGLWGCAYSTKFSCPHPVGKKCVSLSEAYEVALRGGDAKRTEESEKGKKRFLKEAQKVMLSTYDREFLIRRILVNRWIDTTNAVYGKTYITVAIPLGPREMRQKGIILEPRWSTREFTISPPKQQQQQQKSRASCPGGICPGTFDFGSLQVEQRKQTK